MALNRTRDDAAGEVFDVIILRLPRELLAGRGEDDLLLEFDVLPAPEFRVHPPHLLGVDDPDLSLRRDDESRQVVVVENWAEEIRRKTSQP